jgi:methionyl aminopeptidase
LWCLQNGYHGDHAYSFEIEVDPETKKLLQSYQRILVWVFVSLRLEIVEDVGNAFKKYTESFGYGVVRELVGTTRQKMHEDPEMPNYGKRGRGKTFIEGMVAIEPMINRGTKNIKQLKDGWTILTADGKPAHFEHDVAPYRR